VFLVQRRLPLRRNLDGEVADRDLHYARTVLVAEHLRHRVALRHGEIRDRGVQPGLFQELARRRLCEGLVRLDHARDDVPVVVGNAMEHQEQFAASDDDRGLALGPHP